MNSHDELTLNWWWDQYEKDLKRWTDRHARHERPYRMSGLLALLDDVAAIAKVAAASLDDVAAQAAKAGAKAAGAVIDDAAVTPKYVHGFEANRELPIIWKIK